MRRQSISHAILYVSTDNDVSGALGRTERGAYLYDRARQTMRLGALRRGRHVFAAVDDGGGGGESTVGRRRAYRNIPPCGIMDLYTVPAHVLGVGESSMLYARSPAGDRSHDFHNLIWSPARRQAVGIAA